MNDRNYYVAGPESPYHLSAGAVLLNDKNQVCCHYYESIDSLCDFHILMRETLEPGETLEDAVHRGLMEEFSFSGEIISYIGTIVVDVPNSWNDSEIHFEMEKTTPYYLCRWDGDTTRARSTTDPESVSRLTWLELDDAIVKMKVQNKRLQRGDLDESLVLERTKKYLEQNG